MGATEVDLSTQVVRIEPMRRRHLRQVLRIEGQDDRKGWSLGLFMSELSQPQGRIYLVAKSGGAVVGFAGLLFALDDAHITTISVDVAHRRRQIGTRMMLVLARRAVAAGATALTLEVRASNEPAIALYRRFGFAPAGVRKNYYADEGEDALVMWATDVQSDEYAQRLDAIERALPAPTDVVEVGW